MSTYTCYARSRDDGGEKTLPMTQRRIINLVCGGNVVCTATSTIVVHSRDVADLFDQGYFIGQVVRTLQQTPKFTLLDVSVREVEEPLASPPASDSGESADGELSGASTPSRRKQRLWRRYMLGVEGLECNIEEEFLDREMFLMGNIAL